MSLYLHLCNTLGNSDACIAIARRKTYAVCQPYAAYKDLSSHYPDMIQSIVMDWLEQEVDTSKDLPQIITFAQERARYQIQQYLERFEFPVVVPRTVSRSRTNEAKGIDLEYADLDWEEREAFEATDATIDSAWKSLYREGMPLRDAWFVWFLSSGFSLPQAAVLLGKSTKTMRRTLDRLRDESN